MITGPPIVDPNPNDLRLHIEPVITGHSVADPNLNDLRLHIELVTIGPTVAEMISYHTWSK